MFLLIFFPLLCFWCHAGTPVLLWQSGNLSIGGIWSGATEPQTIIGMQFFISLNDLFTNASYGGGTYDKVDESLLSNAVGGNLFFTNGQTGIYDFPVTNEASFSDVVTALTSGTNYSMEFGGFGYNAQRFVTGGSWEEGPGPNLSGTNIDFFRLIVTDVFWGQTNVGFEITGNAQWQIFGSTNQTENSQAAVATAAETNGFVYAISIRNDGNSYTNTPLVRLIGGGGSGAGAYAIVSNGVVQSITLTNAGFGYTNAPLVVIEPPYIPQPIMGIAAMSFLSFSNLTLGGDYQLQQFTSWFWTNQPVSFIATNLLYSQMFPGVIGRGEYRLVLNPAPTQAFATPDVVDGFVVAATVTSGGSGYITSPAVSILGGGGTNAKAVSQISGGVVTGISITDAGIGYTNTPTVRIAGPPAAAVSPIVQPIMQVNSSNLAPYDNYQIQFIAALNETWGNWNGGFFTPTAITNSQCLFITNSIGFFRLQYVP